MKRTAHLLAFVVLFINAILLIGTVGYYFIEDGWTVADAFYMTVITITTVGFGETHDLSLHGRMFTVFIIILGLSAVPVFGAQLARLVVEGRIDEVFGRGKMKRKIADLKEHYIVCGFGRIGKTVCAELTDLGFPFSVVDMA